MKIEINFTNKWLYSLIAIVVVLGLGVGVYAYLDPIPSPGHGGNTILVDVDGVEMDLQQAITDGKIGGIGGAVSTPVTSGTLSYANGYELVVTCESGKRIGCSGGVSGICVYSTVISPIGSPAESCKLKATNCATSAEVYAYCLG